MTEAQKILEMIEAVSPDDTVAMDEIDARVFEYIKDKGRIYGYQTEPEYKVLYTGMKPYTRSRDALKAIRPEGWLILIAQFSTGFNCDLQKQGDMWVEPSPNGRSLPTETLAELHAIIQAIDYDRRTK